MTGISGGDVETGQSVMRQFSMAFTNLEKGLAVEDSEMVSEGVSTFISACRLVPILRPQRNIERIDEFQGYCESIDARVSEVTGLVKEKHFAEARHTLEDLRRVCISCHLKFREKNAKSNLFPGFGNTIFGTVELVTTDGESKEDRSDVVVFLEGIPDRELRRPRKGVVISQRKRRYSPQVLPIVKGTVVEFPNDDTIFHNVFSLSKPEPFDLDIYEPGETRSVKFSRPGLVRIYCNIHPDMISNILVLNNSCFATTDRTGFYVITGVPDGSYPLRTWHQLGGGTREELSFSEDSLREVPLRVKETRRTLKKHRNKFGKRYNSRKY